MFSRGYSRECSLQKQNRYRYRRVPEPRSTVQERPCISIMRHTARPVPIPPYHSLPTVAGRWAGPGLLPDWSLQGEGVGQVPYLPAQGSESLAYMARGRAVEWVACLPGGKGAGPTYLPEGGWLPVSPPRPPRTESQTPVKTLPSLVLR